MSPTPYAQAQALRRTWSKTDLRLCDPTSMRAAVAELHTLHGRLDPDTRPPGRALLEQLEAELRRRALAALRRRDAGPAGGYTSILAQVKQSRQTSPPPKYCQYV